MIEKGTAEMSKKDKTTNIASGNARAGAQFGSGNIAADNHQVRFVLRCDSWHASKAVLGAKPEDKQ